MRRPAALPLTLALLSCLCATPAPAQPPKPAQTQTRDFLQAASESDQFEMVEAQAASTQSRNAEVLAFARRMIEDHARTSATLQEAAAKSGVSPPPLQIGGDQQRMLGELQSLTGPDFDKAYGRQQVLAHGQALVVEERYAQTGPDANVRQAAQAAVPVIQHHLAMAQQLRSQLGGS